MTPPEPRPIAVLIVEDNHADAELMAHELARGGLVPSWKRVDTESDYESALDQRFDVILSDFNVPGFGALLALEILRARQLDVPFIVVSGSIGEETAVDLLHSGAADYLLKDRMGRLGQAVVRALADRQARHDKRQLEEQYRQSQKMEAIGQLAGGIAHDFNNLLTVISGYVELLDEMVGTTPPASEFISELRQASASAATLTGQLLAFSRHQLLEPRVMDLGEGVTTLEPILRRLIGEHIGVKVDIGSGLRRINADPGQVEQVLMNLAVNARDAMPRGGDLRLVVRDLPEENVVSLSVSDTGTGMDEHTRARAFEPFFTTKPKGRGTGLGLSTVQAIVEQSGGTITVDSQLGLGTTFTVRFPRVERPLTSSQRESRRVAPRGTEHVLVVEDEPMVLELMRTILRRAGYQVFCATTPSEALSFLRSEPSNVDLLITDIVLPEMNGRALATIVAGERPGIRVLYVTGYLDGGTADFVLDNAMSFIRKPFTPAQFAQKVQQVLT